MRRMKSQGGVAAVEFALIMPVLMILLIGMIEFGYAFFVKLTITNAAREGARAGSTQQNPGATGVGTTGGEATLAAENYLKSANLYSPAVTIGVEPAPVWGDPHAAVSVTITRPHKSLTGFLESYLSDTGVLPSELKASASMRWELAGAADPSPSP